MATTSDLPGIYLVSECHGASTYNAFDESGGPPVNFCACCMQPCGLLTNEQYVARERAAIAPLTADSKRPVTATVGEVECINVAPSSQSEQLRYFGRYKGWGGPAHDTYGQAEADVIARSQDKPVEYVQHAKVPLSKIFPHGLPKPPSKWQLHLKNLISSLARAIRGRTPGKRS